MTDQADALPAIGEHVSTGITSRIVREYIREVMLPDAVKRLFQIGMGVTTFPTPVVLPGGKHGPPSVAIVDIAAPAAVQVSSLSKLLDKGVPALKPQDQGDRVPVHGVFVLGALGLEEARQLAHEHRQAEYGGVPRQISGGYQPPPGHQVRVTEDDFSSIGSGSIPAAKPAKPATKKPLTKAQKIAAKRRAQGKGKR